MDIKTLYQQHETEDVLIAVEAAESMCRTLKKDIAILPDLTVVPLETTNRPALEIIRWDGR